MNKTAIGVGGLRTAPTPDELIEELPRLVWPNAPT